MTDDERNNNDEIRNESRFCAFRHWDLVIGFRPWDFFGHLFIRASSFSLRLVLHHSFYRLRGFEREKGFVDPSGDLVHAGLQIIQVLVESGVDDFIHTRKGEIGTELSEQFFGGITEGSSGCA